ncbi:MAG: hypothetical protein GVY10_01655 [Verrucomicrobia bacterium]|nr:hypothetical protein [Verrucomicrobiota bacterium]
MAQRLPVSGFTENPRHLFHFSKNGHIGPLRIDEDKIMMSQPELLPVNLLKMDLQGVREKKAVGLPKEMADPLPTVFPAPGRQPLHTIPVRF